MSATLIDANDTSVLGMIGVLLRSPATAGCARVTSLLDGMKSSTARSIGYAMAVMSGCTGLEQMNFDRSVKAAARHNMRRAGAKIRVRI